MSYSQVPLEPPTESEPSKAAGRVDETLFVQLDRLNPPQGPSKPHTQQDYHPGEHHKTQRQIWTRINALERQIEFLGNQLREAKEAAKPQEKTSYSESTAYGILSVIALMCSLIPGFFVAMDLSDGPASILCMGQICLVCFIVLFTTLPFAHKDRHIFRIFTAVVYLVMLAWEVYIDLWAGLGHTLCMVLTVVFYYFDVRETNLRLVEGVV